MLYQKEDELRIVSELCIVSNPLIAMLFGGRGKSRSLFYKSLKEVLVC